MSYKEQIRNSQATSRNKLRKLELKVLEDSPNDFNGLKKWLKNHYFTPIYFTGELKECDAQFSRQIGKGRYHWRIYNFEEKMVIESHYDKSDPGRGFTKERSISEMLQDTTNHILEDVFKEPIHNIIILQKSPAGPQDFLSKLTAFLVELLSS